MGRRDPHAAALVQPPLDYPRIDDHATDVLAVDGVRRARRSPRRTRVADAGSGGGRTLTAEQEATLDDLDVLPVLGPIYGDVGERKGVLMAPSGEPFAAGMQVKWTDAQGQKVKWDDSKLHVRYGSDKRIGEGPHAFRPTFDKRTVVFEVEVWSKTRNAWKRQRVFTQDVQAYCSVDITDLTEEQHHVVATLFSEGGEDTNVTEDELTRVAWCMRNRVDVIQEAEAALAASPSDTKAKARAKFVHTVFGKNATYTDVLTVGQFSGVGDKRYKKAMEPAAKIENATECKRLQLTKDIALDVMLGVVADPYAGQGNSIRTGVFYYMTKERFKTVDQSKWDWDKLPSKSTDKHWYWGLKPDHPYKS